MRLSWLGTERLSWRDLLLIVRYAETSSALFRSSRGPQWSVTEQLLASIANSLQSANWQRGGGKGIRPKPILAPSQSAAQTFGRDPIPISQFDDWWNTN